MNEYFATPGKVTTHVSAFYFVKWEVHNPPFEAVLTLRGSNYVSFSSDDVS